MVKLLLDKGADVNIRENNGLTALMLALATGHTLMVKLLLDKGADVNVRNNNGHTALMIAENIGCSSIVQLLKKAAMKDKKVRRPSREK